MTEDIRDIYNDLSLQHKAWDFCCFHWPQEILNHLTGSDPDGNECSKQNIKSMLSQIEDLGEFSMDEWEKFFDIVRIEGI